MAAKKSTKSANPKIKKNVKTKKKPVKQAAKIRRRQPESNSPAEESVVPASHGPRVHYWQRQRYKTLKEFWPFYLHEHSVAVNRWLHFVGSSTGLALALIGIGMANYYLLIPAVLSGYAFAWVGHFFIEKNRPATFTYPLKSFISDWHMWYTVLTGKVTAEMKKFDIESR